MRTELRAPFAFGMLAFFAASALPLTVSARPEESGPAPAPEDDKAQAAELAKKLQNPVDNLISVPIQNNWDFGYGPANATRYTVNATFLQPFVSYTTKTFTTFGANVESTYDWDHSQWTVPLNASVSQLLKMAKQPIQFALGGKYYADKPDGGPDWGLRFTVTFLFPK